MALTETTDMAIPGSGRADRSRAGRPVPGRLRARLSGRARDRGQSAIEFLGMTPLIILMAVVLWQCALIGYTFSLAGNSADQAAHQGAVTQGIAQLTCRDAAQKQLPNAWKETMRTTCRTNSSGMYTAQVKLKVPVLVPGVLNWPFTVTGDGAYPVEG